MAVGVAMINSGWGQVTYDAYSDLDSLRFEIGQQLEAAQARGDVKSYDDLSLDTLRLLLYLHAKLGNYQKAEEVSLAVFRKSPDDKQALYALLSMNLEAQRKEEVLALAQKLDRLYPDDPQVRYYLGQAYYMNGYYKEANSILSELPDVYGQFENKLYPQEFDIAEQAFQSEDWAYAANMILKGLEAGEGSIAFDVDFEQKERLQQIFNKRLGHVGANALIKVFNEGNVFVTRANGGTEINDRYKVYAEIEMPYVDLDASDLWRSSTRTWFQGVVGLNYNRNNYEANIHGGAHQDGGIFGASIARNFGYGRSIGIDGFYGRRSEDTLLLERLNARTSGAGVFGQYSFDDEHKTYINGRLEGRRIGIDGEEISTAIGVYLNADRIITTKLPQLRGGYRANYIKFSDVDGNAGLVQDIMLPGLTPAQQNQILSNSLPDSIHRHGLFLSWKDYIGGNFSYRGMVGVDYDFEQSGGLYYLSGGLTYYLTNKARIMADLGYFSDPNIGIAGSDLWQALVAFQMGL